MRKTAFALGLTAALGLAALPALSAPRVVNKTIATTEGRPARLGEAQGWNDDCTPKRTTVTILGRPANGHVTVIDVSSRIPSKAGVGTVPPGCVGKPVPGKQVVYTPRLGFRGTDAFEYVIAFNGVPAVTCRISVTVR